MGSRTLEADRKSIALGRKKDRLADQGTGVHLRIGYHQSQ
jgi:hypothetical protein